MPGENYAKFMDRCRIFFDRKACVRLSLAYKLAKFHHRAQVRKGEVDEAGRPLRYFEHPRRTALIILDELHLSVEALVALALLHDVWEDTNLDLDEVEQIFAGGTGRWYSCELVRDLRLMSKRPKEGFAERLREHGTWRSLLVKICDRLDNVRHLVLTDPCLPGEANPGDPRDVLPARRPAGAESRDPGCGPAPSGSPPGSHRSRRTPVAPIPKLLTHPQNRAIRGRMKHPSAKAKAREGKGTGNVAPKDAPKPIKRRPPVKIPRVDAEEREKYAVEEVFMKQPSLSIPRANEIVRGKYGMAMNNGRMYQLREVARERIAATGKPTITAAARDDQHHHQIDQVLVNFFPEERPGAMLSRALDLLRDKGLAAAKVGVSTNDYAVVERVHPGTSAQPSSK